MRYHIVPARSTADLDAVRELFREYVRWLGIELAIKGLEAELTQFPGEYAPPSGDLLLARGDDGDPLACVGLHPLPLAGACEIKRLYVRERARGAGIGYALAATVVEFATRLAYREVMLDTLPWMTSAIAIYRALGFERIPPYWDNIVPGIIYFGRKLDRPG